MAGPLYLYPNMFDEIKYHLRIVIYESKEDPKIHNTPYYCFFKDVGELTFEKYLEGEPGENDQLILYKSVLGKKYEIRRSFFNSQITEVKYLLLGPCYQFVEKCFNQYYNMKKFGLTGHGISPLGFNIVYIPEFSLVFCEFMYEHLSNPISDFIFQEIPSELTAFNYFKQILTGLIYLEEYQMISSIDLLNDVFVDDQQNTFKHIILKNLDHIEKAKPMSIVNPFESIPLIRTTS